MDILRNEKLMYLTSCRILLRNRYYWEWLYKERYLYSINSLLKFLLPDTFLCVPLMTISTSFSATERYVLSHCILVQIVCKTGGNNGKYTGGGNVGTRFGDGRNKRKIQ